ncbi:Schizosaccharomyces specific multicopy membrane protein family 1 [Schizosaccharomyces osmophilus]|uniref:Schizosaccharomyces specific multicopy membrane protein family 1 n=1 Tax=Schizosaccharomyces osmophilus TaxID=2545709 RepID=A0AAF0ATQ9_9SCHI|nr:Schizosaccharomyces specific multicopy membrane protein family 1 [Schizosaccharomyces osmophilus]WBW70638.1 Schizosaccharomyces specific multicopy membrane protein family 1 [Schizosaccharomyces osmophilus]
MLLSSWISALLFAGVALASTSDTFTAEDDDVTFEIANTNSRTSEFHPFFREKENFLFLPLVTPQNVQEFISCGLSAPFSNKSKNAYAELRLKEGANGTVHFRMISNPDFFQAYKHAIDGLKDFKFLKSLVPKANESFLDHSLDSNSNMKSAVQLVDEDNLFYCFVGYQEVPEDIEIESFEGGYSFKRKAKEEYDPIMYVHYEPDLMKGYESPQSLDRHFLCYSVISGCIGLYWVIRWLLSPKRFTFTQFLLLNWYLAFFIDHPLKQTVCTGTRVVEQHPNIYALIMVFGYFFNDGIVRSLFYSFVLSLALGMGYLRHSSKKLVFLVVLLGCVQWVFITVAPFVFPVLFLLRSSKAKPLQYLWMLYNFGYIPLVMLLGKFLADRKHLQSSHPFDAKYMNFSKFILLTILSTFVSLVTHVGSAQSFYFPPENRKIIFGVTFFCVVAYILNSHERVSKGDKISKPQEHLPSLYKDDPEMDLSNTDEKLPIN